MCGEDGAQREVYKLKEEPEKGIGTEKEKEEKKKEEKEKRREREKREEGEKKSNNWKPRTFSRVTFWGG